jgi:uncharacterized protein YggE
MSARRLPLVTFMLLVPVAAFLGGCSSGSSRALRAPGSGAAIEGAVLTAATTSAGIQETGITVTGSAQVHGTPDTLTVSFTISTKALHAADALSENNRRTADLVAAVKAGGVDDKDVATTGLNVGPQWSPQGIVTGYQVDDSITVKLRDLAKAGAVIDSAAAKGGDALRVGGVYLAIDDTSPLLAAARTQAIHNAHDKATAMAAAAGAHLGAVRAIVDQPSAGYPISYSAKAASAAGSAAPALVPVQAGSQTLDVQLTVIYDLAS